MELEIYLLEKKKDLNPFCSIFQISFLSLGLLCCSKFIDFPSSVRTTIFYANGIIHNTMGSNKHTNKS